jgi:hypothetical protein
MIRHYSKTRGTELASMFLSHGESSDSGDPLLSAYTSRKWRHLHRELGRLRERLLPVLSSEPTPWASNRLRVRIQRRQEVMAYVAAGKTQREIAALTGLHRVTVGRIFRDRA